MSAVSARASALRLGHPLDSERGGSHDVAMVLEGQAMTGTLLNLGFEFERLVRQLDEGDTSEMSDVARANLSARLWTVVGAASALTATSQRQRAIKSAMLRYTVRTVDPPELLRDLTLSVVRDIEMLH
jgi:hypothetical protein